VISTRKIADCMLLVLGLFILALGVSVSVKANLGVTPISCVPYVFSLGTPFTLGQLTIAFNTLFMALQVAILRRKYSPLQLLQLPAVAILGYCIDFTLALLSGLSPSGYVMQLCMLLASCMLIAFGVLLVVKADITYIPGDGLILVIADTFRKDFGKTKMCFDCTMVLIGTSSSFILLGKLAGIREGTFLAALLVGSLIQIYNRIWSALSARLAKRRERKAEAAAAAYGSYPVITISREYGSGGHEIGRRIAAELGVSFYDRELIDLTAEQSGFTEEFIKDREQKIGNALLYELYAQNFAYVKDKLPPTDLLFLIQSKIIRDICSREACVIVGRCANFILKDNPNCFNIFIHADNEYRRTKIISDYQADPSFSSRDLEQADHERANYCLNFTGRNWRDATAYHATLDSALYTTEQAAAKLIDLFRAARPRLQPASD